jgi:hypothetical protein
LVASGCRDLSYNNLSGEVPVASFFGKFPPSRYFSKLVYLA